VACNSGVYAGKSRGARNTFNAKVTAYHIGRIWVKMLRPDLAPRIEHLRDINTELTKRLAQLTRKRPRSETLERVERQLVLPLMGLVAGKGQSAPKGERKARREGSKAGGGRNGFPANMPRVPVPNPVRADQRICPLCGIELLPRWLGFGRHCTTRATTPPTRRPKAGATGRDGGWLS